MAGSSVAVAAGGTRARAAGTDSVAARRRTAVVRTAGEDPAACSRGNRIAVTAFQLRIEPHRSCLAIATHTTDRDPSDHACALG